MNGNFPSKLPKNVRILSGIRKRCLIVKIDLYHQEIITVTIISSGIPKRVHTVESATNGQVALNLVAFTVTFMLGLFMGNNPHRFSRFITLLKLFNSLLCTTQ